MTDNRGYHNKSKPKGESIKLLKSTKLTVEKLVVVKKWESLNLKEREKYGYIFENFEKAMKGQEG